MKSILFGNGINIQFGGRAYTSDFILKRIKYNAKLGKYDILFDNSLSSEEILNLFNQFVEIANDIIKGQYDSYVFDEDTETALQDFKSRYIKSVSEPHHIMLEDWFFLLHMFFCKNSDLSEHINSSKQGFEQLILDAIYNDGDIQDIYLNMNKQVKRYFKSFDNIYTLNYDNNIERLTGNTVYHLHGDFSVLSNSENPNNIQGFIRMKNGSRVVKEEMNHCYCNALLDFSGQLKLKKADNNHDLIRKSEMFSYLYEHDDNFREHLFNLKEISPLEYEMIMAKIKYPELRIATEYYFDNFRNIEDELHIVGMSPNNDDHIFKCIINNDKLKKIYYYYFSDDEKEIVERKFSKKICEARSAKSLWQELGSNNRTYNCKYKIPDKIDKFIEIFNTFSDDEISKEKIISEINCIPQFEMNKLCKLIDETIRKRGKEDEKITEDVLQKDFSTVSYIALKNGILPSVLFMVLVMNQVNYAEIRKGRTT